MKELQERTDKRGWQIEWADLINDLEGLKEIKIGTGNKEVLLRSELKGEAGKTFRAAGVAIPPKAIMPGKDVEKAANDE
jgi:hypothetical protein